MLETVKAFIDATATTLSGNYKKDSEEGVDYVAGIVEEFLTSSVNVRRVLVSIPAGWEYSEALWGEGPRKLDFAEAWLFEEIDKSAGWNNYT